MFQVWLPSYLGLNSGRSVSINVNKTMNHFSRNIHGARMFSQCFPVSHTQSIFSIVSFCFQNANYAYAIRQGILTRIRACKQLQKFCEHEQGSAHLTFARNSGKGQILRATSCIPITSPVSVSGFLSIQVKHTYVIQLCVTYVHGIPGASDKNKSISLRNRRYYTVSRRYKFYVFVARKIFHE